MKNENFCSLKCVENSECQSANLRRTDDGRLQCQLLKTDRYKEGVAKWKKDPNSVHMSVKVRGRVVVYRLCGADNGPGYPVCREGLAQTTIRSLK